MDRRKFVRLASVTATAGVAGTLADSLLPSRLVAAPQFMAERAVDAPRVALMKVGHQHESSDEILKLLAAFGVTNICSALPSEQFDQQWSVEGLTKLRERVESFGIKLDMVPLPLSSKYITQAENPNLMLGKSPERDREIDNICQMIRNAARAGLPALKYNLSILGVVRTEPTRGRGGALTALSSTTKLNKSRR